MVLDDEGAAGEDAPQVAGKLFHESGMRSSGPARERGWLHAFRPPNSSLVERTLCAEFGALCEVCVACVPQGGARQPRPEVVGFVALFLSTSPCVSCMGALCQFVLLFPELSVEIGILDE
eukprot:gnl/MRDRNA2_/MRDRNA2_86034_c0_seq1.p2 gnl/MRDRNA2_/MRDRNA2_86034_c0~~gnl/MRDRNA2_/MRDRNA2_86034_c0_seq1.p2  ORF type:complete len:120 (-),score=18.16 gnl/MRDRNA2_/MRDRNA2_86034_c0_seq1:123-482(-)